MTSTKSPKITLYSNHLTPNGLKVSIYLEELKARVPNFDYHFERVDILGGTQMEPWFIQLNPNGRIPVLVDHAHKDFAIFESAAILLYLEQHYDIERYFSFDPFHSSKEYSLMLQWIFFGHGGIGPMQSQAHFFLHFCSQHFPYGQKRYSDETKRLYSVLDASLDGRDWLVGVAGGKFSIADINLLPWIRIHHRAGIVNLDEWPNLKSWLSRSLARPGVQAGIRSVAL